MHDTERYSALRVADEAGRQMAIAVLRATYHREKRWVADAEQQIPADDIGRDNIS
jgi:hypothetical protein